MPSRNENGVKARILFLERYLLDHTDDNHTLTTTDIVDLCRKHGYRTQRITAADDMSVLSDSGMDLISEMVPTPQTAAKAYHVGSRLFELAELKMLVDAVSSSRFITAEKSDLLISKLAELTNEQNRHTLTARIYNADRLKTSNPAVFVNIDLIRSAIESGRKVTFHIWDYTPQKEKVLRHDGEFYTASPYALIWNDDRYYMAGWSDKHQKIVKYRVDRMCAVTILEEAARKDDSFNPAAYARSVIRMFDGDLPEKRVSLLCENSLMQNILDRFGEKTETEIVNARSFRATVNVVPSSTFYSWVFQFQGSILIEAPEDTAAAYAEMLRDSAARQDKLNGNL